MNDRSPRIMKILSSEIEPSYSVRVIWGQIVREIMTHCNWFEEWRVFFVVIIYFLFNNELVSRHPDSPDLLFALGFRVRTMCFIFNIYFIYLEYVYFTLWLLKLISMITDQWFDHQVVSVLVEVFKQLVLELWFMS